MAGLLAGQFKLVLDIEQGNFEVAHGHIGRLVAEKLHENRQTHTGAEHLRSEGVPKLVRDNASLDTDSGGDLMQHNAQFAAERHAAMRAGEKKGVRVAILATQGTETIHYPADEGIHRNKALSPQLAEGDMNGPLVLADLS